MGKDELFGETPPPCDTKEHSHIPRRLGKRKRSPRFTMPSVLVSISTNYIILQMRHYFGQSLDISLTVEICPMGGRGSLGRKESANCDFVTSIEIISPPNKVRNFHIKARKRANYARIQRSAARIRAPAKPVTDSRQLGGRASLIAVLSNHVRPIRADRWCANQLPSCRNCDEIAPPGTQWEWRGEWSPRLPLARFSSQEFHQTL